MQRAYYCNIQDIAWRQIRSRDGDAKSRRRNKINKVKLIFVDLISWSVDNNHLGSVCPTSLKFKSSCEMLQVSGGCSCPPFSPERFRASSRSHPFLATSTPSTRPYRVTYPNESHERRERWYLKPLGNDSRTFKCGSTCKFLTGLWVRSQTFTMPPLIRSNSCVDIDFTLRRKFKRTSFRYGHAI